MDWHRQQSVVKGHRSNKAANKVPIVLAQIMKVISQGDSGKLLGKYPNTQI